MIRGKREQTQKRQWALPSLLTEACTKRKSQESFLPSPV